MSYHIYTTKGIVLSARPWKESDRIYSILTRDLGLIRATALGVRKEASKLRGSLEPLILSTISLVRGKDHWRVTSTESIRKISAIEEIMRPLALVEKLVQGEAHHPELFDIVEQSIVGAVTYDEAFEIKLVSQVMHQLGYLKESDLTLDKRRIIKSINDGIQASHL